MNRRERRANAGAKLQSLIQKEIEKKGEKAFGDDQEEKEYKYLSEEYEEEGQQDITDSDFEETGSEDEFEDEEMSQRLEEIIRQAEKAKEKSQKRKRIVPKFASVKKRKTTAVTTEKPKPKPASQQQQYVEGIRTSSRVSSVYASGIISAFQPSKTGVVDKAGKIKDGQDVKKKEKEYIEEKRLTQQELLEEAKKTEMRNIESLKELTILEQEKLVEKVKSLRVKRTQVVLPSISHHSYTCVVENHATAKESDSNSKNGVKEGRSELRFSYNRDTETQILQLFEKQHMFFNNLCGRNAVFRPKICPITGKPAKYLHPKTGIPYYNLFAYKVIEKILSGDYKYDVGNLLWF